jgi:hypothetical protein
MREDRQYEQDSGRSGRHRKDEMRPNPAARHLNRGLHHGEWTKPD